jgi:hypothetical protein
MKVIRWLAIKCLPVSLLLLCFLLASLGCTAIAPPSAPTQLEPSPKIVSATDYLKSISDDLYEMYATFGLDEDVAEYVLFVPSLPKDFGDYTLQNKLCIQDHKLTELEKQFLNEPDKYLQQMFDNYTTEISAVDPDLVTQLKRLPYFRTLEIKDVEAVEDVLWLASEPKYKSTLEKIYGKGIERKMWSVALEAMVWRAMRSDKNEFDVDNPLEEPDLTTLARLADFQEKYNKEMDETEPVEGKKPQIVGINYIWELIGGLKKSDDDIRFDYALMRWVLSVNAVKIWGLSTLKTDAAFNNAKIAREEGLEVWLEFCPVYIWEMYQPNIDVNTYCEELARFAQAAEEAKAL